MRERTGFLVIVGLLVVGVFGVLAVPHLPAAAWLVVLAGTGLPAITSANAWRRGQEQTGREGMAWRLLAIAMGIYTPVYLIEFLGVYDLERFVVAATYVIGAAALFVIPQPDIGGHRRMVAMLDAVAFGLLVGALTFWAVSGSDLDLGVQALYVVSDAVIMAVAAYLAVRRSTPTVDWAMVALVTGMGAHVAATLIRIVHPDTYMPGHPADLGYLVGVGIFAAATYLHANPTHEQIQAPLRWGRLVGPYVFVVVLIGIVTTDIVEEFADDPSGAIFDGAVMAMLIVMLLRQLAMIAEQRHHVQLDRAGVVSTVSHELRTPLTAMVGYLDLLENWDEFTPEDRQEMLGTVRDQSHVLSRVVSDLVDVARDRIESLPLTKEWMDTQAFLERSVASVQGLDGFEVAFDVPTGHETLGDRDRLGQAIVNLLSNAARYGQGRILIRARSSTTETTIEVHDDGPGVPDTYQLVIWERFERGAYRQSAVPGSGIGLAVARGIARAHGGNSAYRPSSLLGGACFTVTLPQPVIRRRSA